MTKIMLRKKYVEAIEEALNFFEGDKEKIVSQHIKYDKEWSEKREALKELSADELITALYIGYNLKLEPEEIVKEHFIYSLNRARSDDYEARLEGKAAIEAIRIVTDEYNIKIDGVTNVDIENL
jgi:hypothetical protein